MPPRLSPRSHASSSASPPITIELKPNGLLRLGLGREGRLRRIEWSSDGAWSLTDSVGVVHSAELHPSSADFGPWLFLVWKTAGGRRFRALIRAGASAPEVFRALKGRLNC